MIINEVHYTDMFPRQFEVFRKKYSPLVRKRQVYNLYVQFTDYADSTLQKRPYQDPNHSDPVGIYAYPLDYVIKHPADIWYGSSSMYLRVLKATPRNPLRFQDITDKDKAEDMLGRLFGMSWREADRLLKKAVKTYRHSGARKWARAMMSVIQMDLDNQTGEDGWGKPQYAVKSGKEQTQIFLNAGYDALIDDAKKNTMAVINDREPDQIVFLKPSAFQVVEVFQLRSQKKDKGHVGTTLDPEDSDRKLAAGIAQAIGDSITGERERANLMGWSYWWTRLGRRIEIEFARPQSYYDTHGIGEKKHKEGKLNDVHKTNVVLQSEKGKIEMSFGPQEKFESIIRDIAGEWMTKVPEPGWEPENRAAYSKKIEDQRTAMVRQRMEKKHQEQLAELPEELARIGNIARRLNLPWTPQINTNETNNLIRDLMNQMCYAVKKEFPQPGTPVNMRRVVASTLAQGHFRDMAKKLGQVWPQLTAIVGAIFEKFPDDNGLRKSGGSSFFGDDDYSMSLFWQADRLLNQVKESRSIFKRVIEAVATPPKKLEVGGYEVVVNPPSLSSVIPLFGAAMVGRGIVSNGDLYVFHHQLYHSQVIKKLGIDGSKVMFHYKPADMTLLIVPSIEEHEPLDAQFFRSYPKGKMISRVEVAGGHTLESLIRITGKKRR